MKEVFGKSSVTASERICAAYQCAANCLFSASPACASEKDVLDYCKSNREAMIKYIQEQLPTFYGIKYQSTGEKGDIKIPHCEVCKPPEDDERAKAAAAGRLAVAKA